MKENLIAKILFIIGIAQIILGVIIGLAFSISNENVYYDVITEEEYYTTTSMDFSVFLMWFISCFVTGMLFIGFSEVIKLLHAINWKTPVPEALKVSNSSNDVQEFDKVKNMEPSVDWELDLADRNKIFDLYGKELVLAIIPTELEGYCLVKLGEGVEEHIRIVDVGGFGIKEIKSGETKRKIMSWYDGKE